MRVGRRFGWAAVLLVPAGVAAAPPAPKPPRDAPVCAAPGAAPLFVAPMGQPFRAAAGRPYPAAAWFAQADADRDGAVDAAEYEGDARRFFATLDRDGDGRLSPAEVGRYEAEVAPEISLYAARRGLERRRRDAGYAAPLGAGRYAWLNIPEPVAAADADLDRQVTAAEFAAAARQRFATLAAGRSGGLRAAAMPRTTQQQAIEGPCRPPRKPRHPPTDGWDDPEEGQPR